MYLSGVCFITERQYCALSLYDTTFRALEAGLRFIQYREKNMSRLHLYKEALKLRKLTRHFNAALIINDHADIALAVDADGVHLGQDDMPLREARSIMGKKIIGISTHTLAQAEEAGEGGADYIGFGPIFQTATKDAGPPVGIDNLRTIKHNVTVPVVAIGGISLDNVSLVLTAGADAVAVASAICIGDASVNARRFIDAVSPWQP